MRITIIILLFLSFISPVFSATATPWPTLTPTPSKTPTSTPTNTPTGNTPTPTITPLPEIPYDTYKCSILTGSDPVFQVQRCLDISRANDRVISEPVQNHVELFAAGMVMPNISATPEPAPDGYVRQFFDSDDPYIIDKNGLVTGLLTSSSGAPIGAGYVVQALNPVLTGEYVLTAGAGILIGSSPGVITVSSLNPYTPAPPSPTVAPPSPTVAPPSPTIAPPSPTIPPPSPTVAPPSPTIAPPSPTIAPPTAGPTPSQGYNHQFTLDRAATSDIALYYGRAQSSNKHGGVMSAAGSVSGVGIVLNVTAQTLAGNVEIDIIQNSTILFSRVIAINGTTTYFDSAEFSPGTYAVPAEVPINVYLDFITFQGTIGTLSTSVYTIQH